MFHITLTLASINCVPDGYNDTDNDYCADRDEGDSNVNIICPGDVNEYTLCKSNMVLEGVQYYPSEIQLQGKSSA